ncbi:MAG TPA: hypothetical protein VLZ12_07835 [Verrucomicrobiae bacterium]|nr:hypothetical protein [Verrucomicrobiae bacterium]
MQAATKGLTIVLALLLTAGISIPAATCTADIVGCGDEATVRSPSCCAASGCGCRMSMPRPPAPPADDSAITPSSNIALGVAIAPSAMALEPIIGDAHALACGSVTATLHGAPLYSLTHSFLI